MTRGLFRSILLCVPGGTTELRWLEALGDTMGEIATRETRTADMFVAMRPNGSSMEPEHLVEWVLFGTELHSAVKRFAPVGSCKC